MDFWESSNGKGGHIGNLENLCPLFMHKQHLRNLLRHCLGQSFFRGHYFVGHFLWTLEIVNLWGFLWISSIIRRPKIKTQKSFLMIPNKGNFSGLALISLPSVLWRQLNSRQYLGEYQKKWTTVQEICIWRRPCVWDAVVEMRSARPKMVQKKEQ